MGYYKRQFEEELSQGYYNPPDKCVCAKHFQNKSLRNFVTDNSVLGRCDYCSRPYYHCQVLPMKKLIARMYDVVCEWYRDPDNEGVPYSSSWIDDYDDDASFLRDKYGYIETDNRTVYNEDELFDEIGLNVDNSELEKDIIDCFQQHLWADKDYFSFNILEELDSEWKSFCKEIKSSKKYSYTNLPPLDKDHFSDNGLLHILNEIGNIIIKFRLIKRLQVGQKFYRVRNHNKNINIANFKELASPPPTCVTSPNRMSPVGVSMFYASNNLDTSLKEAQGTGGLNEVATWGEFELIREINVIDFTELPECPDFWSGIKRKTLLTLSFLYAFAAQISEQIDDKDKIIEYLPTQIMTGYFEKVFSIDIDTEINGIVFYSSKKKKYKNYALFIDDKKCSNYLKLIYSETIDQL